MILSVLLASCSRATDVKDGDIVFQRSKSPQSQAIAAATHSDYTHIGIVFVDKGVPFVYEAIQPVSKIRFKEWITRGEGGHYVVKRLTDSSKLNPSRLRNEVKSMMGKDYDWLFDWSDERIYCSELVWKAYHLSSGLKLAELRTLGDFDLRSPAVQKLMKKRYGDSVPLKMKVIAPSDIFDSKLLTTIESK